MASATTNYIIKLIRRNLKLGTNNLAQFEAAPLHDNGFDLFYAVNIGLGRSRIAMRLRISFLLLLQGVTM
jgi:hypothetical protein